MVVPFDQNSMTITGEPTAVIEGMRLGGPGAADLAISRAGTLVYVTGAGEYNWELVWVTRDGNAQPVDPDWQGQFWTPTLSPDGTRLAVRMVNSAGKSEIWTKQLDRGPSIKLTLKGSGSYFPAWTPDGRSVTFNSDLTAPDSFDLWTKRADGSGREMLQVHEKRGVYLARWSPDGKWLVFGTSSLPNSAHDILGFRPGIDTAPVPLVATKFDEVGPALSADGRWLAYTSNESGQNEIYVVPFPNTGASKWVVSARGGNEPRWSHGGSELFYRDASGDLVAVAVKTTPTFSLGRAVPLFPAEGFRSDDSELEYDVSADDRRFLMIRPAAGRAADKLIVVENWFEELKAKSRK
jgi:serine/threonine-protein kinase